MFVAHLGAQRVEVSDFSLGFVEFLLGCFVNCCVVVYEGLVVGPKLRLSAPHNFDKTAEELFIVKRRWSRNVARLRAERVVQELLPFLGEETPEHLIPPDPLL